MLVLVSLKILVLYFQNKGNVEDYLLSRVNDANNAINYWSFGYEDLIIFGSDDNFGKKNLIKNRSEKLKIHFL